MNLSKLAKDLKPYISPWIAAAVQGAGGGVGGGGGGAIAVHSLDGYYHAGVIGNSQAPQFPLLAGGRTYTGNLVLLDGLTVDGVDISAHAANAAAHHAPVTAGDGIDLTGQQVSVDVTDIIDTSYGLTESSNNIRVNLASPSALAFSSGGLALASGVAGSGLTLAAQVLAVGAGAGITVNADDVALTTPGGLSVSTTNSASGNHTHAVTASSDVSAGVAALLKSTAAGGLGLASMFTTGAVDVGQGFTAGNTGFRVIYHTHDYPHTHVVVNPTGGWSLDEQFGLDVDDNLLVRGWIVGKHAIQLAGATLLAHYDGPGPFETNYVGNPTGHMGQVATTYGGVAYREGKFGKGIKAARATTNLIINPSFELDVTGGWSSTTDGGTVTRDSSRSHVGTYSAALTRTGAGALAVASWPVISVANGQTVYASGWAFAVGVGNALMQIYNVTGSATVAAAANTTTDAWEKLTCAWTNTTGSAVNVILRMYNVAAGNVACYFDEIQVTLDAQLPYVDGTLGGFSATGVGDGTGHAWTGSAHFSTSSSLAGRLTYRTAGVIDPDKGTVMAWVYAEDAASTDTHYVVRHYDANGRIELWRAGGQWYYRAGSTGAWASGVTVTAGWHLVAVTWQRGALRFYIDGELANSGSYTPTQLILASTFTVGSYDSSNYWWDGLIDELTILSRAISEDEFRAVYESGAPVFAETSTWHWRAGRNRFWADSEGIWMYGAAGGAILGAYAGEDNNPTATKSWGGLSLSEGDLLIGRDANGYVLWDDSAQTLAVKGQITITGGSGYANISDKPTLGTLAAKNSVDLATGEVTNKNLDNVSDGTTYKRVTANEKTGAGRGYTALDSGNALVTKVLPGSNVGTPAGAGLYLGADVMGYYNGSAWKTYMDNSGNFLFGGATGARLAWDGTDLFGTDGTTVQWYARASTGKLYAGGGNVTLDADGLTMAVPGALTESANLKWVSSGTKRAKVTYWDDSAVTTTYMTVDNTHAGRNNTLSVLADAAAGYGAYASLVADGDNGADYAAVIVNGGYTPVVGGAEIALLADRTFIQNEIRAWDSAGLSLKDDGGNVGLTIEDGGRVNVGATTLNQKTTYSRHTAMGTAVGSGGTIFRIVGTLTNYRYTLLRIVFTQHVASSTLTNHGMAVAWAHIGNHGVALTAGILSHEVNQNRKIAVAVSGTNVNFKITTAADADVAVETYHSITVEMWGWYTGPGSGVEYPVFYP